MQDQAVERSSETRKTIREDTTVQGDCQRGHDKDDATREEDRRSIASNGQDYEREMTTLTWMMKGETRHEHEGTSCQDFRVRTRERTRQDPLASESNPDFRGQPS